MTAAVLSSTSDSPSQQAPAQTQTQSQPGLLQPQPSDMASPPPSSTNTTTNANPPNTNNQSNTNRQSVRRSLMSTRGSHTSRSRSRPTSSVFPIFQSSLSYALVRDFAYPQFHPLHYGPAPEPPSRGSDDQTPSFSSSRRLSDPPPSWETSGRGGWGAGPWGGDGGANYGGVGDQLPSTSFDDDAVSDEDVSGKLAKNHRKSKSAHESRGRSTVKRGPRNQVPGLDSQGFFAAAPSDDEEEERETEDEKGAGASTLPAHRYTHSPDDLSARHHARLSALEPPFSDSSDPSDGPGGPLHHLHDGHSHRPTSTSLDESFAGPSLALYNFIPENSNELALREGQIIQVGYRHGQGWLVAMDMESGEQGLVPEEYVRLLSEIEGWGEHLEGLEEVEEGSFEDELASEVHSEASQREQSQKDLAVPGGGGEAGAEEKELVSRDKSLAR